MGVDRRPDVEDPLTFILFNVNGRLDETPIFDWYSRQESNLRLLPPEGSALSTELRERHGNIIANAHCFGLMVMLFIRTGLSGLSPFFGTPAITSALFMPSITLPNNV